MPRTIPNQLQPCTPNTTSTTQVQVLTNLFLSQEPNSCYEGIQTLNQLVRSGSSLIVCSSRPLMGSIIKYFNQLFQQLKGQSQRKTQLLEQVIVSMLSMFAQMLHQNKRCRLPLSRRFLNNLLLVDANLLELSCKKKEISRLYSVILEYLASEALILLEYGVFKRFRRILLSNFRLVPDLGSMRRLVRAVSSIITFRPLTLKDVTMNGMFKSMSKFMRQSDLQMMLRAFNLSNVLIGEVVKRSN